MPDPRFCARCGTALVAPSDPTHKPECPSCGWFRATNALPVVLVLGRTASGKILYTRQAGWPEGAWGLVSGYVEIGETAEDAAVREVREETALAASSPRLVRTLAYGELLLIWIEVAVEDHAPRPASDVEEVSLRRPDLALTPHDWPARAFIEAQLASLSS
jgi:NADH pyrophosphatase NudC (nudix superfamily)